jgi:acetyl-CoA acetyltransferase
MPYQGTTTIVGVGETSLGRHPDRSTLDLQSAAARAALRDAGLGLGDVDGVIACASRTGPTLMPGLVLAELMGIRPSFCSTSAMGGASACQMVELAALAIEGGLAHTVLVVAGENRLSGMSTDESVALNARIGHPEFETPYGPLIPAFYALIARRHMEELGTTPEQLAAVAVAARRHAGLHPGAHCRDPITVEDVLRSKMIADPLHLLDCCLISDGAGALVVTSADRAKSAGPKVRLLGFGEGHTHEHIFAAPSLTQSGAKDSGLRAFRMAGLGPEDVDVALLYDCFTITVLVELEDLGFVPRGESGRFAALGHIALGGKLPVNTHGGLLSHGQPGAAGGIFHITEAVRQLRGQAVGRQVEGARIALVHGNSGAMSAHVTLLLGRES